VSGIYKEREMKKILIVYCCIFAFGAIFANAQRTLAEQCYQDLNAIPSFLLSNDAGAKDTLAKKGGRYFDDAMAKATVKIEHIQSDEECLKILKVYLDAWRVGHIGVGGTPQQQNEYSPHVEIKTLSMKTILIAIPNFRDYIRLELEEIQEKQHDLLVSHPNWIIDVRKNSGGNDSSYASLLHWLMRDEYTDVGAEFLTTPQNIKAQEALCLDKGGASPAYCQEIAPKLVARMEAAKSGEYVREDDTWFKYLKEKKLEARSPAKTAVLIDHYCGSSCEQFLLTVRQSYSVKLIGRRTLGTLDVSNLRKWAMPSGKRTLWYAISRSKRLPDMPVDGLGVMPDIYLPLGEAPDAYEDEVVRVKNWLEGGSLSPIAK